MLRNMSGGKVDPALLESPEQRAAVVENLVRQRVLLGHALRAGLTVTPGEVRAMVSQAPVFQENGQFSLPLYQQFLKTRGQTATTFENSVRQDLLLRQLSGVYAETSFVPRTVAERLLRITEQQRELSFALVEADKFAPSVKLEEDAAKKYYDEHAGEFRIPDQVRVEYVVLSAESALGQIQVDPAEVAQFYEQNARQFGVPESRQASHILIAVDKAAGADAKQKARALAEEIHAAVSKNPGAFADLAKKHSQDPGSAAKGGDLGSFTRGSMVKAFDDAVFGMKVGQISPPVESDFGFHIIRVTGITPGSTRSLAEARGEIENELKKQRAGRLYAELAEKFNNTVFEQSDSLKPAAELVKQAPQQSGWITRAGAQDARLNNPKFIQAIFSEDVLLNKRNSEAVEVAPGTLVSARVIEHKPSAMRPFAEVKGAIEKKLVETRASQLAAQEGRRQLEALRQGKGVELAWSAPQLVSRADPKGLTEPVLRQVYKADAAKLPAYTGVEAPGGGYMLLRISKVVEPQKLDRAQQKSLGEGLAQVLGEEHFAAYVLSLKQKAKVSLNKAQIEGKQ
jgi:peptidyl-prolyl cis-trans isomerase D